jgi:hypothetical protein
LCGREKAWDPPFKSQISERLGNVGKQNDSTDPFPEAAITVFKNGRECDSGFALTSGQSFAEL